MFASLELHRTLLWAALGTDGKLVGAAVFALGAVAWAVWSTYALGRRKRELRAVRNLFQTLVRQEPEELFWDSTLEQLPRLPRNGALGSMGEQFVETLHRHGQWLQGLQHSRAALEIRAAKTGIELQRLREVVRQLPTPVIALDEYQDLVVANHSAAQLLGLAEQAPEKRAARQVLHCEKLVELLTGTGSRASGQRRSAEIELADAQGEKRPYRVTAARLAAREGADKASPGGLVAVLEDIGQQKLLQKRNAEFVSSVSHEMKTPLAGIKAYVELLADGDAEDEATREEFLTVINSQADRLQRLVENMLNLARIEAGVVKVTKQDQSLNAILEEALRVVQPAAESKQITLAGELSPLYLGVYADHDMLLQGAINLLSNAVKYTHSGGKVTLRSRMLDQQVRFEVADTGVGLSVEDCQKVFEKFYRVSKDKNMAAGTGLGLPLAKHIVEDVHGGRLRVESTLGQGSTFIVELPQAGKRE